MRRYLGALARVGLTAVVLSGMWVAPAVAQGSKPLTTVVVNDDNNPVPVRVTDAPAPAPVRTYKRFGPTADGVLVDTVPAGKTFVLTQVNAVVFPDGVIATFAEALCELRLHEGTPGGQLLSIFRLEYAARERFVANQAFSIPVEAGEYVAVSCHALTATGALPPQGHRVTASGYFVPAVQ